jgi:hypothetical protein
MMHKECFPGQGWKVAGALKDSFSRYDAVLAGGTALALRTGYRISYDLDFFTNKDFRVESLISDIRKTGLPFQIVSEGEGTLIANVDGIMVSLFRYDYPFLDKTKVFKGLRIAGILDIASMKVIAISQRGTKRDFVDLYVILRDAPFHRIAQHMVKRFGRERINPLLLGKSLVFFYDADSNPEPTYIKGREIRWDGVKRFLRAHVKQFVFDMDEALKAADND